MNTTRIVRALFLGAAGISFALSVYLWFFNSKEEGLFVGLWVPSILALGIFATAAWSKGVRHE